MSAAKEVRWTPAERSLHAAKLTYLQVQEALREAHAEIGLGIGLRDPEGAVRSLAMAYAKKRGWLK